MRHVTEEVSQCARRSSRVGSWNEFLDAMVECQSPVLGKAENRRCCELLRDRADPQHRSRCCGSRAVFIGHTESLSADDPAAVRHDLKR
jgi:hypothetical protein